MRVHKTNKITTLHCLALTDEELDKFDDHSIGLDFFDEAVIICQLR